MKIRVPPLKSQGIKTKLVNWILAQIPDRSGVWIEPFLGTGVVGLNDAFEMAVFGDVNPHIVRFYSSIQSGEITPLKVRAYLEEQNQLLIAAGDNGYDHYRLVRTRFNSIGKEGGNPFDFLFLNRAGFWNDAVFQEWLEHRLLQKAQPFPAVRPNQNYQSGRVGPQSDPEEVEI